MRIRSNVITREHISRAARAAKVDVLQCDDHHARDHGHAFEITLGGFSKSMTQRFRDERAATYRQWGVFLNVLFEIDPHMWAGGYKNAEHFHMITNFEFADVAEYSTVGDTRTARQFRKSA